ETHPNARVAAVGISGQMHSSVFLDREGRVIRPALLWCDCRTTAECREIEQRVGGEERLRDLVANPALEGFTLPKVLWLRNHEPAAFARLSKVLLAKDYIRYRLTGELATDPSDASATLMYDTAHLGWSADILQAVELPESILPRVGGSSEVLGCVTAEGGTVSALPVGPPGVGGGVKRAGRRWRHIPTVSPGRANAAPQRQGARGISRIEPRALAGASHARRAGGCVLRAPRFALHPAIVRTAAE